MKITKKQLKALIREQVAAVVNETDWRDVSDPDYHGKQADDGPYARSTDEDEWMEDRFSQDQEGPDWDPGDPLPGMEAEGEASVDIEALTQILKGAREAYDPDEPDSVFSVVNAVERALKMIGGGEEHEEDELYSEPEEEGGELRLRGNPTRQDIERLKRKLRQRTGEEPVDIGMVDPRTGKVRVSESELKDMIRVIIEEESGLMEKKKKKKSKAKRTAKGNVTQAAREKHATVGKDKFPIFDKKSAEAAIDLRGHTSKKNQKKIINKAAKYAPAAAKKAREVEKNK